MDRGRYRAILNALGLGGVGLLVVTGPLLAQTPTPTPATPLPVAATATPWVQASPPSTPLPPAKPPSVTIRVDKEGRYYLGNEKDALPADALAERLRKLREAQGDDLHVLIRAELDTNNAAVTAAEDQARAAGIKTVTTRKITVVKVPVLPVPSPMASPSKEEVAKVMARKREEEMAKAAATPVKPPRIEGPLPPDERAAYERNLALWLALPPDERQALRGQATERIREETEKAYASLGLNLNDDQREVFALRYRQERRRLEREIQEKAKAERAHRLPEIMDRLKREFPTSPPAANTPKPAPTSMPTATVMPSLAPAK